MAFLLCTASHFAKVFPSKLILIAGFHREA
jgi:hypothetical protein